LSKYISSTKYHLPALFLCLLIFLSSSIPGDNLPQLNFQFSDKIIHILVFFFLYFSFFYSLKNQIISVKLSQLADLFGVIFVFIFGITDEIHQYFVPNRTCDIFDIIADLFGGLMGYLIVLLITKTEIYIRFSKRFFNSV